MADFKRKYTQQFVSDALASTDDAKSKIYEAIANVMGTDKSFTSPLPEIDTLDEEWKRRYVAQDANREYAASLPRQASAPQKIEYPDWMANAPAPVQDVVQQVPKAIAATQRAMQSAPGKMQDMMHRPLPQDEFTKQFESAVKVVSQKYGIPEAILRGMAALENQVGPGRKPTGYAVSRNNIYNIQAYDSNPDMARRYKSVQEGVEDFAKLMAQDPRYKKAYSARSDPYKMIQEIKNAGYATDKDYVAKVTNTPEFRNNARVLGAQAQPAQAKNMTEEQFVREVAKRSPSTSKVRAIEQYRKEQGIPMPTQAPRIKAPAPKTNTQPKPQANAIQNIIGGMGRFFGF